MRIRQGAGWVPVDLMLQRAADGSVAPKAHPNGLRLSGAVSGGGVHDLVSLGTGSSKISVGWSGRLPEPVLAGTTATYVDVLPSVDLVVEATRTGYKQLFVVKARAGLAQVTRIPLFLNTGALSAKSDGDGGVEFNDAKGKTVGRSAAPIMWDATVEAASLEHTRRARVGLALTSRGPGRTDAVLTPDAAFLTSPDLVFPVTIDPPATLSPTFDAFVQVSWSSDQSGATELKLGTYDGGGDVARSFLKFSTTGLWDQTIISASLKLWEWHSWSCIARSWDAYRSPDVTSSVRWTNQPAPYEKVGTSSLTTGYNTSCNDGWVDIGVTGALQYAATNHSSTQTVMLRATSETDNLGWKRFNSAEAASNDPYVSITYNSVPNAPASLTVGPCFTSCGAGARVSAVRPTLSATLTDSNTSQTLKAEYEVRNASTQATVATSGLLSGSPAWTSGSIASWQVSTNLVNETTYEWRVRGHDGVGYGAWTAWTAMTVDTTKPGVPIVSGTPYAADGAPHGGAGVAGTFTFTPASGVTDLAAFVYKLDSPTANLIPLTTVMATSTVNQSITPTTDGTLTLTVWAKDSAGNQSDPNLYTFKVGAAAVSQPLAGANVARRTKLSLDVVNPLFTRAYFEYRRGPGGVVLAVPSANLTSATGAAITATAASPVTLSTLGGYAVWSASDTLGAVGGVVEVRAQMYTASSGPVFTTAWVRFTVDNNSDGAADAAVGPGSVNLLTGDHTLTSADADELGLAVSRVASSRVPLDGYLAQQELLTANQQQVSSGTTGFTTGDTNCVTMARVTTKGQGESSDSLELTPVTGATCGNPTYTNDSYATLGGDAGAFRLGMQAGRTYRLTGWVYVPAATGLIPGHARSFRLAGFYVTSSGGGSALSAQPNYTDAWQELSVDLTIPSNATAAFFRLYNGMTTGSGKKVYWDNLTVTEIIAPFGPSWTGAAAGGPTTAPFTSLTFPQPVVAPATLPSVAKVGLAGGGWLTFSLNADGTTYTPQPGAEGIVLSKPDSATFRLTEPDGTINDFKLKGSTWALDSSRTTEAASTTSYVYNTTGSRALLTKVINPVEAGVDDANACKAVLVPGCEVLEYIYSTSTSPGLSQSVFGDYVDHVKQVKIWSSDPATGAIGDIAVTEYRYDDLGRLREVWDPRVPTPLKTTYTYDSAGRIATATPPGELPWQYFYGNPNVDAGTLRWDFDTGSGTVAYDTSGNNRNGSLGSAVTWGDGNTRLPGDKGLDFHGTSNDSVAFGSAALDASQSFTVSAWVKDIEVASNWRDAVSKDGLTAFSFQLGFDASVGRWGFAMARTDTVNPTVDRAQSVSVPVKGVWTHLTGVYDVSAGVIRLYVNGVLQATTAHTSTPWTSIGGILVGRAKWNGALVNNWIGSIDDVRMYQKVLTADQIANLAGDENPGRLLKVQRAALQQGSPTTQDGTIATNVVYHVPLTAAAGGPYNLDATAAAGWGQTSDLPTDATALFGPEDTPSVNSATPTAPGTSGYPYAAVHYLNANGQETNTATPGGHIDTIQYDKFGNVISSLQASDREIALGTHPQSASILTDLGLSSATTAARAAALSTVNTYSSDGIDLLQTTGPTVKLVVKDGLADPDGAGPLDAVPAGGTVTGRTHTVNIYDQNKPDGTNYHLITTSTQGASIAGYPDADARTTTYAYNAAQGGTSGWTLRKPTTVVADAGTGGVGLTSYVVYDSTGQATASWGVGATGTDARTATTIYYTAGPNSADAACGNTPQWAGSPCVTKKAGAVTGHDPARMSTYLPERRVTAYTRWGDIAVVTESVPGTTATRTTTTGYDDAGRITGVTIVSGNDGATPVPTVTTGYDPATGQVTTTQTPTDTITRDYDALGRVYRYTDADGGVTTNEFDRFGKPTKATDPTGNVTFTYDRTQEPRGYVTSVTDSIAGTFSAQYSPDGQLTVLHYPNGMTRTDTLDANLEPIERTYTRDSDGTVIYADNVVTNTHGQAVTHTFTGGSRTYGYDRTGRLASTAEAIDGSGCTTRVYEYDSRSNRSARKTYHPDTDGSCRSSGTINAQADHTYDSADRITDAGYTYDAFGRVTTMTSGLTNTFYANDLVASQVLDTDKQEWTLDPKRRFRGYTASTLSGGVWTQASSRLNHYGDDSDSPRWIIEDTGTGALTRMVSGPDGTLAATTSATGNALFQVVNLHGDVATTLDTTLLPPGFNSFDEFGVPATGQPAARYGWLGGKQRSAEALDGVILMGVRLYHPDTGRFLQPDPVDGGSATAYDYGNADPVNEFDLAGTWPSLPKWVKSAVSVVAKVAEVASYIPGPIGTAAAAISAVSYAATGNWSKAGEMALTAAANLVGAGAVVKVAVSAIAAVKVAKVGIAAAAVGKKALVGAAFVGKLGGAAHRAKVFAVEARFARKGFSTKWGGSFQKEHKFGNRFPDIVMEKPGYGQVAIQIGRKTKGVFGPVRPVARERAAIADLQRTGQFRHVFFFAYN
ncbi:MAG: LamG-like jellyroll fold domain-containing protein [Micromonosporaceae bacterium]